MAWLATPPAAGSTPAVEGPKIIANWVAIADGSVPQEGTYVETFFIGKDANNDIKLEADNGDANNPFVMYDASENKWVFSNDGTATTELGPVPSSAVILYAGGACPAGYTDITATYDARYVRVGSPALATGGSATHTQNVVNQAYTTAYTSSAIDGYIAGATYIATWHGAARITDTITVTNGANTPLYADFLLCQKN